MRHISGHLSNLTPFVPFRENPSPLKERGRSFGEEGLTPLLDAPLLGKHCRKKLCFSETPPNSPTLTKTLGENSEGGEAPSSPKLPLPLSREGQRDRSPQKYFMGIDIGSSTSKGVITRDGQMVAHHLLPSGANYRITAQKIRDELLAKAKLSPEDIAYTVATGQGAANALYASQQVTDIRCCARGTNHIFPSVRTVIDVQAQSSQVIRINEQGLVTNFSVSEKCAAGSGRFLEVMANVLQVDLKDIGPLSLKAKNPVAFTTSCAVFGESEAISRVAEGNTKEDILAGVHFALANKISALVDRVGLAMDCAISGGGGLDTGLIARIEQKLGVKLLVPPHPQLVTALGAAIIAEEPAKITPQGKQ